MQKLIAKPKFNIGKLLLFATFVLAIFFRVKVYFMNSSLWLDECSLAMSVINNKFIGALEYGQAAPAGFLLLSKTLTLFAGVSEKSLRFLPFICSILSIFAFYKLSSIYLKKNYSILLANFLFATNYYLIYYSQEFKQYSCDVLIAILVLILLSKINLQKLSTKQFFALGLLFSIIFWFSFISLLVFSGFFVLVLVKKFKEFIKVFALFLPFILNAVLYYIFQVRETLNYQSGFSFWKDGFISYNFSNFFKIVIDNINYFFEPNKFVLFALILIILGVVAIFKEHRESKNARFFLIFPIFALILASYLHFYPIQQRVVLFLIPILLILMVKPLDSCSVKKKTTSAVIILLTGIYFGGYFSLNYYKSIGDKNFFKPTDARGITFELSKMNKPEDILFLAPSSSSPFEFYSRKYRIKYSKKLVGQMPIYDKTKYLNALNTLPDGHYWFYIAHDVSHSPVKPFIEEWVNMNCKNIKEYSKSQSYLIYAEKTK